MGDKDVSINDIKEKHESLSDLRQTSHGLLSSTVSEDLDYSLVNKVVGSNLSGDKVTVVSGKDLNIQGSSVEGTNDVSLIATNKVNIISVKETGNAEQSHYEKTSGIFSGGGLGFTIGSKSEESTTNEQTLDEIGSTIGSINGNVSITAGNTVNSAGTTFITGKDLTITGKDVTIDNTISTVDSQSKYESKQSGLTVSVGNGVITAATNVAGDIKRSRQVEDDRLKALYDYKATQDVKKLGQEVEKEKGNLKKYVSVNVSIGSSETTTEQTSHTETVNTSNINAGGNVNVTATAGDINLKGINMNAVDVNLDAAKNINIDGAQNKQQTTSNTSSFSVSIGEDIGGSGLSANVSEGSGSENEKTTTNTTSVINASDTLKLKSGADTNITGSQVKGDKVIANVGDNLNIASLQDTDNYTAKNQNNSAGVSTGPTGGVIGSVGKDKTDSNYASVTEQAGIFAGKDGFDITVGKNTDLKGAVIASTADADKNKLSTDTLTYSDIQNKADYDSSSVGVNVNTGKGAKLNEKGITPNIGVPASDDASSTTKSAIANGKIEVRSNPNADLSNLSRNTDQAVNALGKIFDKETVQEKQELAKMFGELAYEQVHIISANAKKTAQDELDKAKADKKSTPEQLATLKAKVNSWDEGGANKIALHAFVGGVMANLGGSSALSGAVGAGVNEAIQGELSKRFKDNPDMHQWASALVGAVAAKAVGGNAQTGASTAASGTKNNNLNEREITQFKQELITALANGASAEALQEIVARYEKLSKDERSPWDDVENGSLSLWGFTLKNGSSRELNDDAKQFLKDQIGFNWDAAFATIKSYNPNATDADVWNNLSDHIKANEGAIAWRANQNKEELREASGPVKGETILSLGGTINWDGNGIATSVNDKDGNPHELENPLSRGDYEYSKNKVEPSRYYDNGVAAITINDVDYPAYSAPIKGDVLAELPNANFIQIEGKNYVIDPKDPKKCWYTSKEPPSIRAFTEDENRNWNNSQAGNDPMLKLVDDAKIAATGTDLGGYQATEGEKTAAKQNTFFNVITAGISGPELKVGAGVVEGTAATTSKNIVYRALNAKDAERLSQGLGLEAKNIEGSWTLDQHLTSGSNKISWSNDPFISTTTDINVARGFNQSGSDLGIIAVDLNKIPSGQLFKGWELFPRVNGEAGLPYHYSI